MRRERSGPKGQGGAVALTVAVALLVLLGAAGLTLDLGQLFVAKAEQQNAMDACALAAARELRPAPMTVPQRQRAEAAGKAVGAMNKRLFHSEAIADSAIDVTFAEQLAGPYVAAAAGPANTNFVRCATNRTGILTWFMQVLGSPTEDVGASAVAPLQPTGGMPPTCNISPLGMCIHATPDDCGTGNPGPDVNGLCPGKWYSGRFGTGGSTTGNFNWLDFDRSGGGASAIAAQLQGTGCRNDVSAGITQVNAETGTMGESVGVAWNSRFGLYKNGAGNPGPGDSPPDLTGYPYTTLNWPAGRDAYPDFVIRQGNYETYGTTGNGHPSGIRVGNQYNATPSGTAAGAHGAIGAAGRRVMIMAAVDCSTWGPGHVATVEGLVCALMTTPYLGPTDDVTLEYLGTLEAAGTACGTYGAPGGGGGGGPKVPTLVQ